MRALRAFFLLLLLCGCEARSISFQSPTPTGTATATVAAGSPSGSALPTTKPTLRPLPTPATVTRLLSYERGGDIGQPSLRLLLLADGRVISEDSNGELFERRLTPSGAASLLLRAISTGYFDKDATYAREPLPGSTPPAHGITFITFVVANGGREAHVSTIPTGQPDDNLYQPSAARDKISALALGFEDLSWLPANAWADATPRNYEAPFHRLFVLPQPNVSTAGEPDGETTWPFMPALDIVGEPLATGTGATAWRCAILGLDDARMIGDALGRALAIPPYTVGLRTINTTLTWRSGNGAARLQLNPLLPHEAPTCSGLQPPY